MLFDEAEIAYCGYRTAEIYYARYIRNLDPEDWRMYRLILDYSYDLISKNQL